MVLVVRLENMQNVTFNMYFPVSFSLDRGNGEDLGAIKLYKRITFRLLRPIIVLSKLVFLYALPSRLVKPTAIDLLEIRAQESSAEFVESFGKNAMLFRDREEFWKYAINRASIPGIYAEFGVSWGKSLTRLANFAPSGSQFYGFDSFQGLQEDFTGTNFGVGAFSTGGVLPKVPANVKLVPGWFRDSLPRFLNDVDENFCFIHLDADTYESTLEVLTLIRKRIPSGCILVFDEYIGVPNWQNNEHKAWTEFSRKNRIKFEFLAFAPQGAALRIV
jgi:hypothetical protein